MALLAVVNAAGVPAVIYMPFIPNVRALVLATIYAILSALLFLLHIRAGYREAARNAHVSKELEGAGVLRRPLMASIFLPLLMGVFGFYSASFAIAGSYTYLAGAKAEKHFTVSASRWNSGKYGDCYDTRLLEQWRIAQVRRAVCVSYKADVGDRVKISGEASALGIFAARVSSADSHN
jgi:hypothetical protein